MRKSRDEGSFQAAPAQIEEGAPYAEEVERILKPLRYNAVFDFLREDIGLSVDFGSGLWKLKNIHRFEEDGRIKLALDRFGVCGDLAAFTFDKVRPIFPDHYHIEFVKVGESSFFRPGSSTHYILRIVDLRVPDQKRVFLIDPAFRKYGSPALFLDYMPVQGGLADMDFVKKRERDASFKVGTGTPIVINRKALMTLSVQAVDGRFDPMNYRLVLNVTKRYNYVGEDVWVAQYKDGKITIQERDKGVSSMMRRGQYEMLKERLKHIFILLTNQLSPALNV